MRKKKQLREFLDLRLSTFVGPTLACSVDVGLCGFDVQYEVVCEVEETVVAFSVANDKTMFCTYGNVDLQETIE